MKTFLLLTLLSLYFCRYCNEITSANGVDDCKNQNNNNNILTIIINTQTNKDIKKEKRINEINN